MHHPPRHRRTEMRVMPVQVITASAEVTCTNTTDQRAAASNSDRIKRIHDRVRKVKLNEEAGVRYMQAWEEKYYDREEALEQGIERGYITTLTKQICRKIEKNCSVSEIADMLEEEESVIQPIYDVAKQFAPDYDLDSILEVLLKKDEGISNNQVNEKHET